MLRQGNTGSRIFKLQSDLTLIATRHGRPDFNPRGVDGIFGNNTRTAVINLQRAMRLRPDGVVGRQTGAVIRGLLSAKPGTVAFLPKDVRPRPVATRTRPVTPDARTRPAAAETRPVTALTRYIPPLTTAPGLTPAIDWRIVGIIAAVILALMIGSTKEKK